MFTGIIESIGTVREFTRKPGAAWAHIQASSSAEGLRVGDSIAVDGACLTVTAVKGNGFTCDLSAETLDRTTLGTLRVGSRVNLERPLRLGDRLGGHLVTGHVDAVGEVAGRTPQGEGEFWRLRFPQELAPLLVMKGSIAVDRISLTVAELSGNIFGAALIPHTLRHTTLGSKHAGNPVNLEADLLGKHVARLLAGRSDAMGQGGLTLAFLEEHGFA
jgi:riboflavin synthase